MRSHSITSAFHPCDQNGRSTRRTRWNTMVRRIAASACAVTRCSIVLVILLKRLHWISACHCISLPSWNAMWIVDRNDFDPRRQRRLISFAMILKRSPLACNQLYFTDIDCSPMRAAATGFPWRARAAQIENNVFDSDVLLFHRMSLFGCALFWRALCLESALAPYPPPLPDRRENFSDAEAKKKTSWPHAK